jgi:hypothetical protein
MKKMIGAGRKPAEIAAFGGLDRSIVSKIQNKFDYKPDIVTSVSLARGFGKPALCILSAVMGVSCPEKNQPS